MKILVTGPQGSGKSTQAVLLAQDLGVPYIAAGEIFRNLTLIDDSQKAEKIRALMSTGELIPIEMADEIINRRLQYTDCQKGFVLDGFPRNLDQLNKLQVKLDHIIYINVSDKEGIARLLKRKRADDTEDVIGERLSIYHAETKPLLAIFKRENILEEVNGERPISQIHTDIVKRLKINDIH